MSSSIVLIAYSFPPANESGALRPFRFYRYLREFGVAPIVITATLQLDACGDIVFVRDVPRDFPRTGWAWHAERIVRKLFFPGALGLTWNRDAAARGAAVVPRPDAVLSTSPPFSAHLAAMKVKRRLKIPWLADFRDPMDPLSTAPRPRLSASSLLEAVFIERADVVIVTTDTLADLWKARYPRHRAKFHVIWNGFDPSDQLAPLPVASGGPKRLVHVGELYGGRDPRQILESLDRLVRSGALPSGSLRLSLVGSCCDDSIPKSKAFRRLVEERVLEFVPERIPQGEARLLSRQADALLLLQPHTNTQVPAKLFDYIRVGRPVLALVRRDSPSERILSRSGVRYRSVYPNDLPHEVDAKILEFLSLPGDPVDPSKDFDLEFNGRLQARRLADLIASL